MHHAEHRLMTNGTKQHENNAFGQCQKRAKICRIFFLLSQFRCTLTAAPLLTHNQYVIKVSYKTPHTQKITKEEVTNYSTEKKVTRCRYMCIVVCVHDKRREGERESEREYVCLHDNGDTHIN